MTHTLDLRAEAEAEAERLAQARVVPRLKDVNAVVEDIGITTMRASANFPWRLPGAIFIVRARLIDQTGRLFESLVVPVLVNATVSAVGRKRREVRNAAERILEVYKPAVKALAHEHVSNRGAEITARYGAGVGRSIAREKRLMSMITRNTAMPVQAGLFDRRSLNALSTNRHLDMLTSEESRARVRTLRPATAEIAIQEPDVVLLLILSPCFPG